MDKLVPSDDNNFSYTMLRYQFIHSFCTYLPIKQIDKHVKRVQVRRTKINVKKRA